MPTLLTWTDRPPGPLAHHRPRPAADVGPVRRLVEHSPSYDRVIVLTTEAGLPGARKLQDDLGATARLRLVDVTDPSDHAQIFAALAPLVDEVRGQRVDVCLSAGTPQAQTLWVILVQAGLLDGRMLQVVPPAFVPDPHPHPVREVRLDIEGFPEIRALRAEVVRLRAEVRATSSGLIGASLEPLLATLARLAPSDVPVWVRGETGTGKELVARALHDGSTRAEGPYVAVNAGAFTESVLTSELFGHVAGAFTGAIKRRRGLFEQADGGTLFLDEVGELPARVQVSLLRVLETGRVRPVGAEAERAVDVRIVAATHRDLRMEVAAGRIREDLYYRLRGAELHLPPLRERGGDLEVLVHHFLGGRRRIGASVWEALRRYAWPGNVRELRAEVQRWELLTDEAVGWSDLSPEIRGVESATVASPGTLRPLADQVAEVERAAVWEAMERAGGNRSAAARTLGVDRNTLKRKLRAFGWSDP